jgi:regulator of RNase E activity RraA
MFVIKDRPKNPDPELIKLLKDVEPATVGHFRHYGFVDPNIRPVLKDTKVVGAAITVKTPGADSTVVHKVMEIAKPGDVLVIDRCGDREHACWGGDGNPFPPPERVGRRNRRRPCDGCR